MNYSLHRDKSLFSRTFAAELVIKALKEHESNLFLSSRHDIFLKAVDNSSVGKVSGSAYKLSRDRAYHHGTLLLSTNLSQISGFLKSPLQIILGDEKFKFGGVSSVPSPVANIPNSLSFDKFVELMEKEFQPTEPIQIISENDRNDRISLYEEELSSWNWTFGKSPPFKLVLNDGNVLEIESGIIKESSMDSNFIGLHFKEDGLGYM